MNKLEYSSWLLFVGLECSVAGAQKRAFVAEKTLVLAAFNSSFSARFCTVALPDAVATAVAFAGFARLEEGSAIAQGSRRRVRPG